MRLLRRPALLILLAGVVMHVGVLVAAHWRTGRIDGYAFKSLDSGEFYQLARNLAGHGVFSDSETLPLRPHTWRTPGYPLFLAAVVFLLGDSPTTLVIVQQGLSILNVLLLFWIATTWMSQRRAVIVALLFLAEPYHLYYSLWLMSTTLFVTVLLLTWYTWQRALAAGRWWVASVGALSGFAVLVRPVAGFVPIAMFAGLTVGALRRSRHVGSARRTTPNTAHEEKVRTADPTLLESPSHRGIEAIHRWLPLPVFAVSCLVVVGGWVMRNHRVAGHFALSDQGGVVLAYFKATEVVLWRQGRAGDRYLETTLDPAKAESAEGGHTVWEDIDARLRNKFPSLPEDQRAILRWQNLAQGNRTLADSFAVSKALTDIGWSYLTASPLSTAMCCLVRCGSLLTFPLSLALKPPAGIEGSRLGWFAKGIPYLVLCVFVIVRIIRGGRGKAASRPFGQLYYPLSCTIALLLATTPQIDPRFRVPMIPFLLVIALLHKETTQSSTV